MRKPSRRLRWPIAALAALSATCVPVLLMRAVGGGALGRQVDPEAILREEEGRTRLPVQPVDGPSNLALEEAASECLRRYQEQGEAVLASAGYLDLLGRVWGCTIQGDGWVDVCVIRSDEGGGSSVRVERLEVDAWARELGFVVRGGEDAPPQQQGGRWSVHS